MPLKSRRPVPSRLQLFYHESLSPAYHFRRYSNGVIFSAFLNTLIKYPASAKPHNNAISSIELSEKRSSDLAWEIRRPVKSLPIVIPYFFLYSLERWYLLIKKKPRQLLQRYFFLIMLLQVLSHLHQLRRKLPSLPGLSPVFQKTKRNQIR